MVQNILIAESRELLRIGLKTVFADDDRVSSIHETATIKGLEAQLRGHSFDLVVVNQVLITNIELLPQRKFVILAAKPDITILKAAYIHQGCGYISDNVSAELLLTVLNRSENTFLIEPSFTPWVMDSFFSSAFSSLQEDLLTVREKEIVGLIRKGIDRAVIARKLCITEATLKTHIKNISRKRQV